MSIHSLENSLISTQVVVPDEPTNITQSKSNFRFSVVHISKDNQGEESVLNMYDRRWGIHPKKLELPEGAIRVNEYVNETCIATMGVNPQKEGIFPVAYEAFGRPDNLTGFIAEFTRLAMITSEYLKPAGITQDEALRGVLSVSAVEALTAAKLHKWDTSPENITFIAMMRPELVGIVKKVITSMEEVPTTFRVEHPIVEHMVRENPLYFSDSSSILEFLTNIDSKTDWKRVYRNAVLGKQENTLERARLHSLIRETITSSDDTFEAYKKEIKFAPTLYYMSLSELFQNLNIDLNYYN